MTVNGRNKPVATKRIYSDGAHIRVDFKLDPTAWVEIVLTVEELQEMLRTALDNRSDES